MPRRLLQQRGLSHLVRVPKSFNIRRIGVLGIAVLTYGSVIAMGQERNTIAPPNGILTAHFGTAIAINGNRLAVLSRGEKNRQPHIPYGVFVFERASDLQWHQADTTIVAPASIESPSTLILGREFIAIGFPTENVGPSSNSDLNVIAQGTAEWARGLRTEHAGVVHLLAVVSGHWNLIGDLAASSPQRYAHFGSALSVNESLVAVGAPEENQAGAVYLFDVSSVRSRLLQRVPAEPGAGGFGSAIALGADVMLVGAPVYGCCGNAVYAYKRDGEVWRLNAKIINPVPGSQVGFGQSIALAHDLAVIVGSGYSAGDGFAQPGSVDVFRYDKTSWTWEARIRPRDWPNEKPFGYRCCVATDGQSVFVLFERNLMRFGSQNGKWAELERTPLEPVVKTAFGTAMETGNDYVAVGVANSTLDGPAGSVVIFPTR